jgi:hypothetical protein
MSSVDTGSGSDGTVLTHFIVAAEVERRLIPAGSVYGLGGWIGGAQTGRRRRQKGCPAVSA